MKKSISNILSGNRILVSVKNNLKEVAVVNSPANTFEGSRRQAGQVALSSPSMRVLRSDLSADFSSVQRGTENELSVSLPCCLSSRLMKHSVN